MDEEIEESITAKASIQFVYPSSRRIPASQDAFNLEVSVSRLQKQHLYRGREVPLYRTVRVTEAIPHRFHIEASIYGDLDSLREALREVLIRQSNLRLSERDIVYLAEVFQNFQGLMNMTDFAKYDDQNIVIVVEILSKEVIRYWRRTDEEARVEVSIRQMKLVKFQAGMEGYLSSSGCAVCLDEFADGIVVVSTPCKHLFHDGCLRSWLVKNKRNGCPMCRAAF